jgi:hypothetical protein
MEIKSEVIGSCVEEIKVSVEVEYEGRWLCCEQKYRRFIWAAKAAQNRQLRSEVVPGIGCLFWGEEVIEEIKRPCICMGFWCFRFRKRLRSHLAFGVKFTDTPMIHQR